MDTTLFVYTGTGNSLALARQIGELLGSTTILPIPALVTSGSTPLLNGGRVGIIAPVHYSGVPALVARWLAGIQLSKAGYVFSVMTSGGVGYAALKQLNQLCTAAGHPLDAGWMIPMVDSYIPYGGPPDEKQQQRNLDEAEKSVLDIVQVIRAEEKHPARFSMISSILHILLYQRFIRSLPEYGGRFSVDTSCNGCGICAKVCSADNISIESDRPHWGSDCVACLACIHFCKATAIQMGEKSRTRRRYHHPGVTVRDMIWQKNDSSVLGD